MIYNRLRQVVEIVGGPYPIPIGRLDFVMEAYLVRRPGAAKWQGTYCPLDHLTADGGRQEIETAVSKLNTD